MLSTDNPQQQGGLLGMNSVPTLAPMQIPPGGATAPITTFVTGGEVSSLPPPPPVVFHSHQFSTPPPSSSPAAPLQPVPMHPPPMPLVGVHGAPTSLTVSMPPPPPPPSSSPLLHSQYSVTASQSSSAAASPVSSTAASPVPGGCFVPPPSLPPPPVPCSVAPLLGPASALSLLVSSSAPLTVPSRSMSNGGRDSLGADASPDLVSTLGGSRSVSPLAGIASPPAFSSVPSPISTANLATPTFAAVPMMATKALSGSVESISSRVSAAASADGMGVSAGGGLIPRGRDQGSGGKSSVASTRGQRRVTPTASLSAFSVVDNTGRVSTDGQHLLRQSSTSPVASADLTQQPTVSSSTLVVPHQLVPSYSSGPHVLGGGGHHQLESFAPGYVVPVSGGSNALPATTATPLPPAAAGLSQLALLHRVVFDPTGGGSAAGYHHHRGAALGGPVTFAGAGPAGDQLVRYLRIPHHQAQQHYHHHAGYTNNHVTASAAAFAAASQSQVHAARVISLPPHYQSAANTISVAGGGSPVRFHHHSPAMIPVYPAAALGGLALSAGADAGGSHAGGFTAIAGPYWSPPRAGRFQFHNSPPHHAHHAPTGVPHYPYRPRYPYGIISGLPPGFSGSVRSLSGSPVSSPGVPSSADNPGDMVGRNGSPVGAPFSSHQFTQAVGVTGGGGLMEASGALSPLPGIQLPAPAQAMSGMMDDQKPVDTDDAGADSMKGTTSISYSPKVDMLKSSVSHYGDTDQSVDSSFACREAQKISRQRSLGDNTDDCHAVAPASQDTKSEVVSSSSAVIAHESGTNEAGDGVGIDHVKAEADDDKLSLAAGDGDDVESDGVQSESDVARQASISVENSKHLCDYIQPALEHASHISASRNECRHADDSGSDAITIIANGDPELVDLVANRLTTPPDADCSEEAIQKNPGSNLDPLVDEVKLSTSRLPPGVLVVNLDDRKFAQGTDNPGSRPSIANREFRAADDDGLTSASEKFGSSETIVIKQEDGEGEVADRLPQGPLAGEHQFTSTGSTVGGDYETAASGNFVYPLPLSVGGAFPAGIIGPAGAVDENVMGHLIAQWLLQSGGKATATIGGYGTPPTPLTSYPPPGTAVAGGPLPFGFALAAAGDGYHHLPMGMPPPHPHPHHHRMTGGAGTGIISNCDIPQQNPGIPNLHHNHHVHAVPPLFACAPAMAHHHLGAPPSPQDRVSSHFHSLSGDRRARGGRAPQRHHQSHHNPNMPPTGHPPPGSGGVDSAPPRSSATTPDITDTGTLQKPYRYQLHRTKQGTSCSSSASAGSSNNDFDTSTVESSRSNTITSLHTATSTNDSLITGGGRPRGREPGSSYAAGHAHNHRRDSRSSTTGRVDGRPGPTTTAGRNRNWMPSNSNEGDRAGAPHRNSAFSGPLNGGTVNRKSSLEIPDTDVRRTVSLSSSKSHDGHGGSLSDDHLPGHSRYSSVGKPPHQSDESKESGSGASTQRSGSIPPPAAYSRVVVSGGHHRQAVAVVNNSSSGGFHIGHSSHNNSHRQVQQPASTTVTLKNTHEQQQHDVPADTAAVMTNSDAAANPYRNAVIKKTAVAVARNSALPSRPGTVSNPDPGDSRGQNMNMSHHGQTLSASSADSCMGNRSQMTVVSANSTHDHHSMAGTASIEKTTGACDGGRDWGNGGLLCGGASVVSSGTCPPALGCKSADGGHHGQNAQLVNNNNNASGQGQSNGTGGTAGSKPGRKSKHKKQANRLAAASERDRNGSTEAATSNKTQGSRSASAISACAAAEFPSLLAETPGTLPYDVTDRVGPSGGATVPRADESPPNCSVASGHAHNSTKPSSSGGHKSGSTNSISSIASASANHHHHLLPSSASSTRNSHSQNKNSHHQNSSGINNISSHSHYHNRPTRKQAPLNILDHCTSPATSSRIAASASQSPQGHQPTGGTRDTRSTAQSFSGSSNQHPRPHHQPHPTAILKPPHRKAPRNGGQLPSTPSSNGIGCPPRPTQPHPPPAKARTPPAPLARAEYEAAFPPLLISPPEMSDSNETEKCDISSPIQGDGSLDDTLTGSSEDGRVDTSSRESALSQCHEDVRDVMSSLLDQVELASAVDDNEHDRSLMIDAKAVDNGGLENYSAASEQVHVPLEEELDVGRAPISKDVDQAAADNTPTSGAKQGHAPKGGHDGGGGKKRKAGTTARKLSKPTPAELLEKFDEVPPLRSNDEESMSSPEPISSPEDHPMDSGYASETSSVAATPSVTGHNSNANVNGHHQHTTGGGGGQYGGHHNRFSYGGGNHYLRHYGGGGHYHGGDGLHGRGGNYGYGPPSAASAAGGHHNFGRQVSYPPTAHNAGAGHFGGYHHNNKSGPRRGGVAGQKGDGGSVATGSASSKFTGGSKVNSTGGGASGSAGLPGPTSGPGSGGPLATLPYGSGSSPGGHPHPAGAMFAWHPHAHHQPHHPGSYYLPVPMIYRASSYHPHHAAAGSGYHPFAAATSGGAPVPLSIPSTRELKFLTGQIEAHYDSSRQTPEVLEQKFRIKEALCGVVKNAVKMDCTLYLVGSSLNGFGSKHSDLDICLMFPDDEKQNCDPVEILAEICKILSKKSDWVRRQQLIQARVPILRAQFTRSFGDVQVDLNCNNPVGIRNTHLLLHYANWDTRSRVAPLVLVVKEWAARQNINDASCSTLSSYSLELMVIHFLQCGVEPAVLPSLQEMYPEKFGKSTCLPDLDMKKSGDFPSPAARRMQPENTMSLAELLLRFLEYYTFQFDYEREAISVRRGRRMTREMVQGVDSPHNHQSQWKGCICIQEPFTLSNTARNVYDELRFRFVQETFYRSWHALHCTRNLDSIMQPSFS